MQFARSAVLAGVAYGLLMGIFFAWQAWSAGKSATLIALFGLGSALSCGLLFGGAMYAFTRWRRVRSQIELQPGDLLPGERLLHSSLANLLVKPEDFRLRPFVFGGLQFLAGMKDKEVIGGALHLTNLRVLFKSHRFNRLHGAVSIFLPSIVRQADSSRWPVGRLRLATRLAEVEFITANAARLLAEIEAARAAFGPADEAILQPMRGQLAGIEALQPDAALNALNTLIHRGMLGSDLVQAAVTPLVALGGLLASEVFNRTLAERWSQRMQGK